MVFGFLFLMSIDPLLTGYEVEPVECGCSSDDNSRTAENGARGVDVSSEDCEPDDDTCERDIHRKPASIPKTETLKPTTPAKPTVRASSRSKTEGSTNSVLSIGSIVAVTLLLFLLAGIIIARTKASQTRGIFGPIIRCLDRRTVAAAIIVAATVVVSVVVVVVIVVVVVVVAVVVVVVAAAMMVVMPPATQWPRFTLGQA